MARPKGPVTMTTGAGGGIDGTEVKPEIGARSAWCPTRKSRAGFAVDLTGPILATQRLLDKSGLGVGDIELSRSTRRSPVCCWPGRGILALTSFGSTPT